MIEDSFIAKVQKSIVQRPLALLYVAGLVIGTLALADVIGGWYALILFTVFYVLIFVHMAVHEIAIVHGLVNSQHDELVAEVKGLVARNDQLIDALINSDVAIPPGGSNSEKQTNGV